MTDHQPGRRPPPSFAAPASWVEDWAERRSILAVRLDALGDVLMTTPAIRALRAGGRTVTLLTSPAGAGMADLVPEIDDVIPFEAPWMKSTRRTDPDTDLAVVRRLRDRAFDGAVIFTVFSQSPLPAAYVCHLAGIPRVLAHVRENPYRLVTHWVPEPETGVPARHEVQRQLDLVAMIGALPDDPRLSLRVPPDATARIRSLLADLDPTRPWAVVHPGASAPARRYPWERFAAAADTLTREDRWQLMFSGTEDERELVERIRAGIAAPTRSLAGLLSLPELAALLEAAPLLLSNNTGPVHIAAALGTPVVDLYALTNDQHTPWMVQSRVLYHDVPCRNCLKSICPEGHHHCLRLVSTEAVVEAARELMLEASKHGAPRRPDRAVRAKTGAHHGPSLKGCRLRPSCPG